MKDIQCKTRIIICSPNLDEESHGFGRGAELLLLGIKENGSLNNTTKKLGMAYSKAWRILRQVEQELGVQLVARDGARGSRLTEEGEYWLQLYQQMVEAAQEAAQAVLAANYPPRE